MTVHQLPGRVREFVNHLNGVLARLDQGAGWCAVFWQRDPDGMRACLDGREVPPWDVVEALLQDVAAAYGSPVAEQETRRLWLLHAGALAAHDARPGGRDALGDRLDVMLREQRYASDRLAGLGRRLASAATHEQADAVRLDLAWARDDHDRATARCAELRHRMAALDRLPAVPPPSPHPVRPAARETPSGHAAPDAHDTPSGHDAREGFDDDPQRADADAGAGARPGTGADGMTVRPRAGDGGSPSVAHDAAAPDPVLRQRKRRRGSARFAGLADDDVTPLAVPPAAEPAATAPAVPARRTLRGARFAGAAGRAERVERVERDAEPRREPLDAAARRETVEAVERLLRLRAEGRSGEAHALLVELAGWPAARIPLLAAELQRTGLAADWTTLLWEAASLPPDRLVAAADALAAVGRADDGEQILRQGVARPAAEIGQAVLALVGEDRRREARALLDAYVRVRTPEEAARSAAPDPRALVPLLLEAARAVSEERRWDLVHALRVAGFTA
ncbi:hypothetical protein OG802_28720 [Streptomyces sp. NBC_00704]|uniref:hypothetical protein n=1 Tax=Streptomyces sp. NBC_00704 TaxID=2975809 RepID=UPI002E359745|nr:hypothetical protein [Streptomyces sp. NBC_00704]